MKRSVQLTLTDYLVVLTRQRWLIILNFVVVALLAFIISSLLPRWYRATATILPPRQDSGLLGLSSLAANLPFAGLDLLKGSEEVMTYKAILESRSVMEAVANKFDLKSWYKSRNMEHTIRTLRQNVGVGITEEGTLTVSVLDRQPDRAAAMANAFIFYLDSLNTKLNIQKARNDRLFIEKRFDQNKSDLARAEMELKQFQEKYGAVALPEQTEAAIKGAAELQASIYATEVELGVKNQYLTPDHADIVWTKNKLAELKKKLDEMKFGSLRAKEAKNRNQELFIPFTEIPGIGLEYARLFREVEVQNKLFGFLIQQYEQAKIMEAKNIPTVQVLDQAVPPVRKAKPKRLIIMLGAGLASLFLSLAFVLSVEHIQRLKEVNDERYAKLVQVVTAFKRDGVAIARKLGLRR